MAANYDFQPWQEKILDLLQKSKKAVEKERALKHMHNNPVKD